MEMERQQPSRTPEGNRPRDKDHGTRSMGQILSREEQPQESRRRTISFSSEEPYRRFFGMEILDHGENAVDLSRLNSVGVLLFNHNTDKVVGKVIRAWVENHRGMAEVEFDTDDDAEKIFGKVRSGTLKTTSVRYSVDGRKWWPGNNLRMGDLPALARSPGSGRRWRCPWCPCLRIPLWEWDGPTRARRAPPSPCISDRSKQTKI